MIHHPLSRPVRTHPRSRVGRALADRTVHSVDVTPDVVGVTPRRVLVVDDSKAQRKILSMQLVRWGYHVTEAASGDVALALCQTHIFDIILSDWMMPGMTGVEFCSAFRALPREGYGYFILLTSKSEKAEIASGLEGGADDFLTKPVSADELHARLRAGERILGMQSQLIEKNLLIGSTLGRLQQVYDSLDRDLIEARKVQQTLVRDRYRNFGKGAVSLLLRPSGHVGGDLVGFFEINTRRVSLYSIDVSGHGVASAMLAARLAGMLMGTSADQNQAMTVDSNGRGDAWPPEITAARFNRMMIEDLRVEQYFTMAFAEVDLETGRILIVQAGHPHPMILRANGKLDRLGSGGLPIGLIPNAQYDRITAQLWPGDRLFLISDGVTECTDPQGAELGESGLIQMLIANAKLDSPALLEALIWDLAAFNGNADFSDDVSGLVFDYSGPVKS